MSDPTFGILASVCLRRSSSPTPFALFFPTFLDLFWCLSRVSPTATLSFYALLGRLLSLPPHPLACDPLGYSWTYIYTYSPPSCSHTFRVSGFGLAFASLVTWWSSSCWAATPCGTPLRVAISPLSLSRQVCIRFLPVVSPDFRSFFPLLNSAIRSGLPGCESPHSTFFLFPTAFLFVGWHACLFFFRLSARHFVISTFPPLVRIAGSFCGHCSSYLPSRFPPTDSHSYCTRLRPACNIFEPLCVWACCSPSLSAWSPLKCLNRFLDITHLHLPLHWFTIAPMTFARALSRSFPLALRSPLSLWRICTLCLSSASWLSVHLWG